MHDGIGARRFKAQRAPDRADVLGVSDDPNQKGQPQLLKRERGRTPTGTLAVGHQRRGRHLRLDEHLFQKSDDLLSQRGRGWSRWRDARTWLDVHDCCIMHSRKSFLIPNNSHERIFLHVLCVCKSILNLVVPHALAVNLGVGLRCNLPEVGANRRRKRPLPTKPDPRPTDTRRLPRRHHNIPTRVKRGWWGAAECDFYCLDGRSRSFSLCLYATCETNETNETNETSET